ncbi:MAG: TVP38/TMEM64 family protein [Clostridiales bacterium]|nr:TVP38/TMEM64 family protein [Clostridiales bacterium]
MNTRHIVSKRAIIITLLLAGVALITAFGIWIGGPLLAMLDDPALFQEWVQDQGAWSKIAFVGVMTLQVVIAWLPGEPLEIGAGYTFGFWEGTMLCMLGIVIGSVLVFALVRKYGRSLIALFFSMDKIDNMPLLQNPKRLTLLSFIVFLIPGTPKDILTYCVGLTRMKFTTWLSIAGIARIPSVVTSTYSGHALGEQQQTVALIVLAGTILLSVCGILIYRRMESPAKGCAP